MTYLSGMWRSRGALRLRLGALAGDCRTGEAFAREMGVETLSRDKVIQMTYGLLDIVTFLTANEKESHAWPIPRGSTALRAAGAVHSDLERGFIRAETISFEDLARAGSWAEARSQGLLRLEGKDYVVQEGDVILFRFKV